MGCGLCASMFPDSLSMGVAGGGYLRPMPGRPLADEEVDSIYAVCPGIVQTGMPRDQVSNCANIDEVWGPWCRIDMVYATDPRTRFRAATGGALTGLAEFLLDSGAVESVLHVAAGGLRPPFGHAHISRSRDDVRAASGSCYGPAPPLEHLGRLLELGEKFAVVAKPCDISAVRLLGRSDERVKALVSHYLTMVCGGMMPPFGMNKFLVRIGIAPDDVAAVSYRGHGCPGPTRIELKNGDVIEKTYLEFWGTDSSKWHLPWRCKVCPDGTGEAADIAAADTWPGGAPTEEMMRSDPGTNVVIARTQAGMELVDDAVESGYLVRDGGATITQLNHWQGHHVRKKIASEARYEGMRNEGQLGIETVDLRNTLLRKRMAPETDLRQVNGAQARIRAGKHRDDYQ